MKKFVYLLIFLATIFIYTRVRAADELSVYFIPHQDDEMFMAGHIVRDLSEGKNVYIVLVTNGNASNIYSQLNDIRKSMVVNDCKFPAWVNCAVKSCMEGFNKVSFSKARNRELLASLETLGVNKDHVYFGSEAYSDVNNNLVDDGHLTADKAQKIVEEVANKLGSGVYSTLYPYAKSKQHHDHKALGLGLRHANLSGSKRFFYEGNVPGTSEKLTEKELNLKHKALNSYFLWMPEEGRFSIGGHSVQSMLNFWKSFSYEFVTTTAGYVQN